MRASSRLPAELPSLPAWKESIRGDSPILGLRAAVRRHDADRAERCRRNITVARQLSQIGGVSEVNIYGQRKPARCVCQASPEKLSGAGPDVRGPVCRSCYSIRYA